MDRWSMVTVFFSSCLCLILMLAGLSSASANGEGDALSELGNSLSDPNSVLSSWDPTLVNPCTWFHVTCNSDNRVSRVDLGNANLSGQLVPQLGQLQNLEYLEHYSNNISGRIPSDIGNLTNLVSLNLYLNSLNGLIPDTLSRVQRLRFLYGFWSRFLSPFFFLRCLSCLLGRIYLPFRTRLHQEFWIVSCINAEQN